MDIFKKLLGWSEIENSNSPSAAIIDIKDENLQISQQTNLLIKEIHNTFNTEVDRLLEMTKQLKSNDTQYEDLIRKYNRLKKLGFSETQEMVEAKKEIDRLESVRLENISKEKLAKVINYFSVKYPHYKFITEESVKSICQKYGLIYGPVSKYTGTVPDENLTQMEEFKISPNDTCYIQTIRSSGAFSTSITTEYINEQKYMQRRDEWFSNSNRFDSRESKTWEICPLEIVAPEKDFKMTPNFEVKDFQVVEKVRVIPDPIVLQPVVYGNEKYYLIVTAWGEEASDVNVVNEKMN